MELLEFEFDLTLVNWVNVGCITWFFGCWIGYARFARHMAKKSHCIASTMHSLRVNWMEELIHRDARVADASIIANLERNVAFMASTSILVLAGIFTMLASVDKVNLVLSNLHITTPSTSEEVQLKLLLLALIFVYAFFTFTWSLRQFGFCGVIIGATPLAPQVERKEFAVLVKHGAKVFDQASHSYNFGLRAFYFSMACLGWFIHPIVFVIAVAVVVWVLYQREFQSSTMKALLQVSQDIKQL
ncbi:DUF599 domain-containing protein [Sessilibacter corallicola]|uniref:DUF599 domain-containing protein n=1 Tax=Sessilibacter corallicola TaxID=2904075 RepID=A0ABQ0A9J8_9GAMM|nr:DUF599 domain-containing protein [Sessilibacter corallicola]MCE2030311.1 DUF599 domain-containing protein [Sessilibacter corallicola]